MASKGYFIVLEGIDGCGKTTIANLLAKQFRNVWVTKEPTTQTAAGKKIQAILQHKQSAPPALAMQKLYIADRIVHTKKIEAALARGKTVICQRYAISTFAYGTAFGVTKKDLQHDFLKPDATILLDLPAQEAMKRIEMRKENREYFEKKEKLEKIRKKYLALAKSFGATVVDARPAPELLINQLTKIVRRRIIQEK